MNNPVLHSCTFTLLGGAMLMLAATTSHATNSLPSACTGAAPATSLAGMDLNLQIEHISASAVGKAPTQGAIVQHYHSDGTFSAEGTGSDNHVARAGTYQYRDTGAYTAVDTAIASSADNAQFTTNYTFCTAKSGLFVQHFASGKASISGHFTMVPSQVPAGQDLAPASIAGLNVALVIKRTQSVLPAGSYPSSGLVVQTYAADGTLKLQGIGPGTINSHGTYVYKKVSANTAVEQTDQISDLFEYPYTMVYTFKTPTSGSWYQNFADGLIIFTGTFDTFPN